jgi:hypothetical protein
MWQSSGAATLGSSTNGTPSDSSSSLPPPSLVFGAVAVDLGEIPHGVEAWCREEDGAAGFIGRRLGFEDAGVGGGDAVQGRVEAIRRRQHSRAWAMGAGAAGVAPCPAPPRCVTGKRNREKGIRMVADG